LVFSTTCEGRTPRIEGFFLHFCVPLKSWTCFS
jgi:hypothetical protein